MGWPWITSSDTSGLFTGEKKHGCESEGRKKILTDSSDSFWIARPFILPGRLALMYIHPQNLQSQIQSIKWTRKPRVFGFLKAQEELYENNSISYVAFWCWCVLPNTAESANMTSSASACRRPQKYCVGIKSTCSRQADGKFKVEWRNSSFM